MSVLPEDRHRDAAEVFGGAYLIGPVTDQMWERSLPTYQGSLVHGILEDDGSVGGVARSFDVRLAIPGGRVDAAAVSSVGVRADRRRRGYLRALMREQLATARDRGAVVAALRATEASIYARFGYGVASSYATVTVRRRRAVLRTGAAAERELRMLTPTAAGSELPRAYYRISSTRPGTIDRPAWWWASQTAGLRDRDQPVWTLCTIDASGQIDGWLSYTTSDRESWDDPHRAVITVLDLVGADERVELALWQAALGIDLAEQIVAPKRPLDTTLPLALTDPRAAILSAVEDETWLRILDVPAALAARSYAPGEPVVLGVTDELLPGNSGRYLVGPEGVAPTEAPAQLHCGVADLAATYLGGTRFSALAAAGRVHGDAESLARADLLFATPQLPWSGTYY